MHQRWRSSSAVQKRARELRHNQTPEEKLLWQFLSGRQLCGEYFRRQVPVGIYVVDFYCANAKLAIELDGAPHQQKMQQVYDRERTAWLDEAKGIRVLRFFNGDVRNNLSVILQEIEKALKDDKLP